MSKKIKSIVIAILVLICFKLSSQNPQSKILNVPYKVQPNSNTCQSTCLKMMAMFSNVPGKNQSIEDIYNTVNKDQDRPEKVPCTNDSSGKEKCPNRWGNIVWWWNDKAVVNSTQPTMKSFTTEDPTKAIEHIISNLDNNKPLIMSVTNEHAKSGHLVLVLGYKDYLANQSHPDFRIVCHDPNGKFFPELSSELHSGLRHLEGYTNVSGSEMGPGAGVEITIDSLKKINKKSDGECYFAFFVLE